MKPILSKSQSVSNQISFCHNVELNPTNNLRLINRIHSLSWQCCRNCKSHCKKFPTHHRNCPNLPWFDCPVPPRLWTSEFGPLCQTCWDSLPSFLLESSTHFDLCFFRSFTPCFGWGWRPIIKTIMMHNRSVYLILSYLNIFFILKHLSSRSVLLGPLCPSVFHVPFSFRFSGILPAAIHPPLQKVNS